MPIGDADNMLGRLKSLIPPGWFAKDTAQLRDVVLGGLSDSLAASFAMLGQGRDQTRITTATGYFLDLKTAELFDPGTATFSSTGSLATARIWHAATSLSDGTVLVTGGNVQSPSWADLASAEVYSPSPTASIIIRISHTGSSSTCTPGQMPV